MVGYQANHCFFNWLIEYQTLCDYRCGNSADGESYKHWCESISRTWLYPWISSFDHCSIESFYLFIYSDGAATEHHLMIVFRHKDVMRLLI